MTNYSSESEVQVCETRKNVCKCVHVTWKEEEDMRDGDSGECKVADIFNSEMNKDHSQGGEREKRDILYMGAGGERNVVYFAAPSMYNNQSSRYISS